MDVRAKNRGRPHQKVRFSAVTDHPPLSDCTEKKKTIKLGLEAFVPLKRGVTEL